MFRGALSPHRQPLLDDAQAPTPPKKPAASSLRNLFFGKDEAQLHNDPGDEQHAQRNVGSMRARTPSQASNKIAPDAVMAMATATSPPPKRNNPRDTFQRTKSQPIRLDASAALSASRAFDPSMSRAAALVPGSFQSQSQRSPGPPQCASPTAPQTPRAFEPPSLRSTVYGSCSHVLSTVMNVLVQTIKTHREYMDATLVTQASPDVPAAPQDNNTVRKAKLLYIALLEKAQKERGEWQGFGTTESNGKKERASSNNNEEEEEHHGDDKEGEENDVRTPDESAKGLLTASIQDCTKEESFTVLNELLELSFRNLRVALVSPAAYSKHRHALETQSLSCPASLETLLRIGAFVSDLSHDEKRCLLHLLGFWYALCVVDPTRQELKRIVEEKHALVLSESSEMEFMQHAARKSAWSDLVAIDVLIIMAQYREMIFSDLEFYTIRQDMQIDPLDPEPEVIASQSPSETDSPEIDVPEDPEEDAKEDSPPSPQESLEGEPSMSEVLDEEPPAPEANSDDVETRPASPVAGEDDVATDGYTPPPQEPSSLQDDVRRGSFVVAQASSTPQSSLENEPTAPTSTTAHATIRSPASTPAPNKIKSPRAKGPKPRQYAATMVSPRFKRSRLVYPSIHSVAAAVTPRQRRAGGVGAMSVDEVLPYVAVALAAASMGVLATVAFFAVRKPAH